MAQTTTLPASALGAGGVVGPSEADVHAELDELFRSRASIDGRIVERLGEVARRQSFRDEGATSLETWAVERFGVSVPTARAYVHVAEKADQVPHLVGALCDGEVSLDKVRAVLDVATPSTEGALCEEAKACGVRELSELAQMSAARQGAQRTGPPVRSEHDRRYLRFNDTFKTMTVQLPAESYAQTKACLEARAREIPSDDEVPSEVERPLKGKTPSGPVAPAGKVSSAGRRRWDQRLHDAFIDLIATGGAQSAAELGHPVLRGGPCRARVPWSKTQDSGELTELAGELEHDGLIDTETARRIACDATMVVALDDEVGHTMYEGRARRFPTGAQRREVMRRDRRCRFPGCTAVTFTNIHHIVPWKPGGRTDLDNICLTCRHHHGVVHRKGWTMSGNANEELTFRGPNGRVMTSRPSPLWTRVGSARS